MLIFLGKETHSETTSWKSSRISTKKVTTTTVNPGNRRDFACESKFLHFSSCFHHCSSFFSFFSFSFFFPFFLRLFFHFFHFFRFFFCFFFSFFLIFLQVSSFSFSVIVFLFLSCSFFFFFCFFFFFFLSGAQNLLFRASISSRFLSTFYLKKKQFFGPSRAEGDPTEASYPVFFVPFFLLFLFNFFFFFFFVFVFFMFFYICFFFSSICIRVQQKMFPP